MNRNDRALTGFTMLGHATFHTYELVIPILVVVWLDAFSTTPAFLGAIVGASYAATGVGALPSGILSDRISGKRLVVASMAGMGGGFLIVSAAPNLATLSVGLLVWGIAASLYHPAGLSLISRGATERGTAFAYHGAAGNVGVATGPLLGAILLAAFDWRTVAALLVVPVALAVVVALGLEFDETAGGDATNDRETADRETDESGTADRETDESGTADRETDESGTADRETDESETADREVDGTLREFAAGSRRLFVGGFLLVFVIGGLYGLYYRGVFTFLPDVLAGVAVFDPVVVGGRSLEPSQYVYSGLLLLGGVGQYVGGRLVDRYPAERVLVANFGILVLVALAFLPAANAGAGPLLVVSGLLGFFVFLEGPVNQEVVSKHVPRDLRGLSFGWTYVAIFGVGAGGSALSGAILTRWSPAVLFAALAGIAVLAGLVGGLLLRRSG
ncbi:MFS transporter [Halopenitus persicus]|uniref:Predicted arabinose efflux permease, MFS family n=1 Tax=Halopenitus persicus TaxID=1048396 RepID=A0A1H3E9P7_9EURY|nr:MFS transporter [Halopenitus persicus]SDX74644.1 Predicted arabinose efflux permease, MFS family [Halopenitus persicus]